MRTTRSNRLPLPPAGNSTTSSSVAFAEAMYHYFTMNSIAKVLEKDHSSINYYVKNSGLYAGYYDFYNMLKEAATCIYHLEVGNTALGMRLKENIKEYVQALEA